MRESQARLAELDALRGVAVILVVLYHYTTRVGELFPSAAWGEFAFGSYGVHLFFVISGFVIVMTLERSARALDFVVARFSRLYPAYWTGVLATALVLALLRGPMDPPSLSQVLVNLTMLQSFFKVPPVDGVYWTLEVELLFYAMMLGLFSLGWLSRAHRPIAAWLALSALYYSPAWQAGVAGLPLSGLAARLLILEYAPFFVIGVMFYRLHARQGNAAWNYGLAASAWCLVSLTFPAAVAAMILAASGVLWKLSRGGLPVLCFRPLVFFGTISYSLYLVHQNIGQSLIVDLAAAGVGPALRAAVAAAFSIALAAIITFSIERPALKAIRRCYRTRCAPGHRAPSRQAA